MVIYMNGSFYPKGCHRVGTDALVCPYCVALSLIKGTPLSKQRRRSVDTKRASLHIEEVPSLFANNVIYSPLHSERGRGRGFT